MLAVREKLFKTKEGKRYNKDYELLSHTRPKSAMAEAYRTLRTNLGFAGLDNGCRSVLLSSPSPADGKSTVTANLGVVMAQAGKKTLIVDCDLRKPVQHRIFQLSNHRGVTNCLLNEVPVEEIVHRGPLDNLFVLTSGPIPPNPAEILAMPRTQALWSQLLETYDHVFIDAPPVLAITDAVILSTQVDGVILVVRQAFTRNNIARQAKEQFERANAKVLGVVLNQVRMDSPDYYYSYYYYYGHYGHDEQQAL